MPFVKKETARELFNEVLTLTQLLNTECDYDLVLKEIINYHHEFSDIFTGPIKKAQNSANQTFYQLRLSNGNASLDYLMEENSPYATLKVDYDGLLDQRFFASGQMYFVKNPHAVMHNNNQTLLINEENAANIIRDLKFSIKFYKAVIKVLTQDTITDLDAEVLYQKIKSSPQVVLASLLTLPQPSAQCFMNKILDKGFWKKDQIWDSLYDYAESLKINEHHQLKIVENLMYLKSVLEPKTSFKP